MKGAQGEIEALSVLLTQAVAEGAGVSFLHPLAEDRARAYWQDAFAAAARGERIILGAFNGERLAGTVTLHLDLPENQPHRAEIWKMIVAESARRQGIASELLAAAEMAARALKRTLLVLETVTGSAAEALYEKRGWTRVGEIPDFALLPDGKPWPATVFYKQLDRS
jgi:ribosomal protein S18 acetylase RimI-like enzyme